MNETAHEAGEGSGRLAGLDLLRAGAIVAVLFMHLLNREFTARHLVQPGWSGSLGYFGVELFFILSGFLIGRILIGIAANNPGPRDWALFLVRRWMRTLPLYFLWLVVLLAVIPPANFVATAAHYVTFTQNLAWPMGDWFPVSWSLAVEEWFYLLFSFVLLLLAAARVRGAVLWTCLLFVTVPLAGRIILIPPDAPFDIGMREVALVRLDAIAWGVVAAWSISRAPVAVQRWRRAFFFGGIFFLLAPADILAVLGSPTIFTTARPYLLSLTPIGFALWIPGALDIAIPAAALRIVRWLSTRSYALYIVHLSMIDLAWAAATHLHMPVVLCAPAAVLLSAGLAELSYRYLETPILRLRPRQPVATTNVAAAVRQPVAA